MAYQQQLYQWQQAQAAQAAQYQQRLSSFASRGTMGSSPNWGSFLGPQNSTAPLSTLKRDLNLEIYSHAYSYYTAFLFYRV